VKLRCWSCEAPLDPVDVLADGTIEPRTTAKGGPLYHYRCPRCGRANVCERNARGRILARPRPVVPLVDRLQALLDGETAEEDAARRAWWARNDGIVDWFHEELVEAIDAGLEDGGLGAKASAAGIGDGANGAEHEHEHEHEHEKDGDPYEVLGVPQGAGRDEVVRAFRRLAKEHHPDRFHAEGREAEERARRRFVRILDAYERLRV
jgi:hypothetical protein